MGAGEGMEMEVDEEEDDDDDGDDDDEVVEKEKPEEGELGPEFPQALDALFASIDDGTFPSPPSLRAPPSHLHTEYTTDDTQPRTTRPPRSPCARSGSSRPPRPSPGLSRSGQRVVRTPPRRSPGRSRCGRSGSRTTPPRRSSGRSRCVQRVVRAPWARRVRRLLGSRWGR